MPDTTATDDTTAPVDTTAPDIVILIHGTGAADPEDRGVRWWQTASAFESRLAASLSGIATILPPFHWSGANSEVARRAAARELLEMLRRLEDTGRDYHLVAHSHGGSVLWQALIETGNANRRLKRLRSWTSVGTPFFTFRPVPPAFPRWLAAALLCGLCAWLLVNEPPGEWLPVVRNLWRAGSDWALLKVGILAALLFGLAAYAIKRVAWPLVQVARDTAGRGGARRAATWYGDLWLALWHPLDEPINALSGTVGEAPRIAPRLPTDRILGHIPFLGPALNLWLTRAADEFAWKQVTDGAQGADLKGYRLARVGRAPAELEPGFDGISISLADALANSADAKSVEAVRRMRTLLESAYDRQGADVVWARIREVFSFQEIIHTSYFDNTAVEDLVAARIRAASAQPAAASAAPLTSANVATATVAAATVATATVVTATTATASDAPRRAQAAVSPGRAGMGSLIHLEGVAALLLAGIGALLAVSTASVYEAVIAPETERYQIARIVQFVTDPTRLPITSFGETTGSYQLNDRNDKLGTIIADLADLGALPNAVSAAESLASPAERKQAAFSIARRLGAAARWDLVEKLASSSRINDSDPGQIALEIRVLAMIEAAASQPATYPGAARPPALDAILDRVQPRLFTLTVDPMTLNVDYRLLGRAFRRFGDDKRIAAAAALPGIAPKLCSFLLGAFVEAVAINPDHSEGVLPGACSDLYRRNLFFAAADIHRLREGAGAFATRIKLDTLRQNGALLQKALLCALVVCDAPQPDYAPEDLFPEVLTYLRIQQALTNRNGFGDLVTMLAAASDAKTGNDIPKRPERNVWILSLIDHVAAHVIPADESWQAVRAFYEGRFTDVFPATDFYEVLKKSARIFASQGHLSEAQNLLKSAYARSRTSGHGLIRIADAAAAIGYSELQTQVLKAALDILRALPASQARAELAISLARQAAGYDATIADEALSDAERGLVMVAETGTNTQVFQRFTQEWIERGAYARARIVGERAPERRDTLDVYERILARIIRVRGGTPGGVR